MSTVITDNLYHGSEKVNMIMLNGERIYQGVTKPAPEPEYDKMYLTIEALENGNFTLNNRVFKYSVNDDSWVTPSASVTIPVSVGDKIKFKAEYNAGTTVASPIAGNTIRCKVYGNIMSLMYGDNFTGKTEYRIEGGIFSNCTGLVDAGNLILPATSFAINANYYGLFAECVNLRSAPELPALTIPRFGYSYMFKNCSSLTRIKCLATDISASNCLEYWVLNISPTGTFVKKAGVTWPTGASGIPSGWTVIEE